MPGEKFMESLTGARWQPLAAAVGNPALGRVYYGAVRSRVLLFPDDRRTSMNKVKTTVKTMLGFEQVR